MMIIIDWLKQIADRVFVKGEKKPPSVANRNESGVVVTHDSAYGLSALWSCLSLLSETIGGLPLEVYRRIDGGGKETARDSWVYGLLQGPNADMVQIDFISYIVCSMALRGNAYIRVSKDSVQINTLTPLDPGLCTVVRKERKKVYKYQDPLTRENTEYSEEEIIHIPAFGYGGIMGMSLLDYAKNSIGIAISAELSAGEISKSGLTLQGALETDQKLNDEQRELFKKAFREAQERGEPALILENGLKFQPFHLSAAELQLIENRKFNVEEICRWLGVPPALVGHTEKSTSWGTGMEQQDLAFLKYRLSGYLIRIQQRLNRFLLPAEMRAEYFCEFNITALLRTDSISKANYYSKAMYGWMTVNEIRSKENEPPVEGGDQQLVPVNMTTLEKLIKAPVADATATDNDNEGIESIPAGDLEVIPEMSLNGAQVTALLAIVRDVALGALPRDAAIGMIEISFNMTSEQAERALGSAGNGFAPSMEEIEA